MKSLLLFVPLWIVALPALAQHVGDHHHPAFAPIIGAGVPAALAIGGLLLGVKLWNRKR